MSGRLVRAIAAFQGLYFTATGLWPLFDIESFQAVTGPKVDLWLVRTVGVLVAAIGATLLLAAWRRRIGPEIAFLAVASALGLAGIDIVYATTDVIADIYLLDAVAEVAIAAAWIVGFAVRRKDHRPAGDAGR